MQTENKETACCGNPVTPITIYNCGCCNHNNGDAGETSVIPYIGENGNWFIGEEDTGVKAQGETGPAGPQGLPGSFSSMEKLFDGVANQTNVTYQLSNAITDYSYLVLELGMKYRSFGNWGKQYINLPFPEISSFIHQYGKILKNDFSGNTLYANGLTYYFPTELTMKLGWVGIGNPNDNTREECDTAILKIYGLK